MDAQAVESAAATGEEKIVGILQPGYIPWLGFFEQLHRSDLFVLYDDVQFEKGSWRNRNRIKTAQGATWLTVPVRLPDGLGTRIDRVVIREDLGWRRKHRAALVQNYSKAAWFQEYSAGLLEILDRPWESLLELDEAMIRELARLLGIDTPIIRSSELGIDGSGTERLVEILRHLGATEFYEGAAGRDYLEVDQFQGAGIRLAFQDYRHPTYPQRFGEFVSHLSVVDLLFNCGPESLSVLIGETA